VTAEHPVYSAIIPVLNSATIVGATVDACIRFFSERGLSYEILLIDDGSTDASWEVIQAKARSTANVIAVRLLRNYGQHTAVHCGLALSRGEHAIVLDDDMQNPPDELLALIEKSAAGHDLVFGRFRRKRHSFIRRAGSSLLNRVNTAVFRKPPELVLTNFKIMHRSVIDRVLSHRTHFPYINGLAVLYARNPADVLVEHHERPNGKSNYGLLRIVALVARVLFSYSAYPLRLVTVIGLIASALSLGVAGYVFTKSVVVGTSVPGWASMTVILTFFNGITLLVLGITGEYVVRILQQTSRADPYHVIEIDRAPDA
jgi:glycosyltransferase involved in cell wall biosynthesis